MNCKTARKWISAAMDGELSLRHKARLQEHLQGCDECRRVQEAWSGYGAQMKAGLASSPSPEQAWVDIRRAIRVSRPESVSEGFPVLWGRLRWAGVAAALLLTVSVLLVLRRPMAPTVAALAPRTEVESVETSLPGAMMMVYEDQESGMTMIWVVEANGKEQGHAGS